MAVSSRDRFSVDLLGLRTTLLARAEMLGISPSAIVRGAVVDMLDRVDRVDHSAEGRAEGRADGCQAPQDAVNGKPGGAHRVRLELRIRISAEHKALIVASARRSRLNVGDYLGGLAAGVPALVRGGVYGDHLAELRASSAELATLARNIHRLARLLRQGDLQQARPYRDMLDSLSGQVRAHLEVAAHVLADLRPGGVAADHVRPLAGRTR